MVPTWYLEVEVAGAAHRGDRRRLPLAGDALLHAALAEHLHRERTAWGRSQQVSDVVTMETGG